MTITKEDFEQWKVDPVTKEILDIIAERRDEFSAALSNGATLNLDSMENTFANTVKTVGIIEGINTILNLSIGDGDD